MGTRILAVDDTPAVIDFIRSVLEPEGFEIFVATDGSQCLRLCGTVRPDLILLDIMMPGMDGYETCRRIKAEPETAAVPVIFLSALARGFDAANAFAAGAADYVSKPVEPAELLARVRTHLAAAELAKRKERDAHELETLVLERTAELRSALDERDALLREINHRVKNNLQLLAAIIDQEMSKNEEDNEFLSKLMGRIESIAFLYDQLWFARRLDGIEMNSYLRDIARYIVSRPQFDMIRLEFDLEPIVLPLSTAMPCGIMAYELIHNAACWAYGADGGTVFISMKKVGGEYFLSVRDEGVGCSAEYPGPSDGGLGFRFLSALSDQVSATVDRPPTQRGCEFVIRFPV